ncbi:DUF3616 domain-containing protein [Leptolyngbya sp. FACHB-261]|uniref:DUF3616 domain-containing protein n=1 Tax=Leptolyngbya sp. FACHB-261 TaxID=2692806 RepID=UPI0016827E26|nr:DUF3616 domain-containing protein [Leptolyngbya sp. FACHB-261]MBD2104686.1 DUF3616 domain-containing protein [Leptolyngbya sp. FACHB-261]
MQTTTSAHQVLLKFDHQFEALRDNLSVATLTPDGHLWLASDETASLERLSPTAANTFAEHQRFALSEFLELPGRPNKKNPQPAEVDIEGLAFADHYLWLVGSHSSKRCKPKPDKSDPENIQRLAKVKTDGNRYLLARIPLVEGELHRTCPHPNHPKQVLCAAQLEGTYQSNCLLDALRKDIHLGPFLSIPSKDNGFDIEGLAVIGNQVFIGLRGPVLRGWAVILELQVKDAGPSALKLKKIGEAGQPYKKHFVDLNGLGIRELCLDGSDLLILAGPTMALDGPVKIFRLPCPAQLTAQSLSRPTELFQVPHGQSTDHAEGITLCPRSLCSDSGAADAARSILVVYDAPADSRKEQPGAVLADVFELS